LRRDELLPYAAPILKLLSGVLTDTDSEAWNLLLSFQREVRLYLRQIGLELHIEEIDGYAFLSQPREDDEQQPINLPTLTARQKLSHLETSLLVFLRQQLHEHENLLTNDNRLFILYSEMHEWLLSFWKPQGNAKSQDERIKRAVNRLVDMGFIRKTEQNTYLVQRVIKSKLDSSQLLTIRENLSVYYAQERDDDADEWNE
jgi:hypothetical protein